MGKTAAELRQDIEQQRADIERDVDAIGDRVSPGRIVDRRTEAVRARFQSAKAAVMGSDEPGGSGSSRSVADRVGETKDQASELAHSAVDGVTSVPGRVRSGTTGNPLAAGLVAFGLGLIAATVLPASKREEELVSQIQPQLERASAKVVDSGRELADGLRPELQDAAQEIEDEAAGAGQRLVGEAKQAVQPASGS